MLIKIKRENGSVSTYRNAWSIPAFLLIPQELLRRASREIYTLPRCRAALLRDRRVIEVIESDLFLATMSDIYAYMAWPHMGLEGKMEGYSGFDPCWKMAHAVPLWVDGLEELSLLHTLLEWLALTEDRPVTSFSFAPYDLVDGFMAAAVPYVLDRDGHREWMTYVQKNHCWEDFDYRPSKQKTEFYRKWYHTRTAHPTTADYHIACAKLPYSDNHYGQMVEQTVSRVDVERFVSGLSKTDRKIMALRLKGRPLEEIAKLTGFKTHSAVLKRIRKVGKAYERYAGTDLGFDEKKIV